MLFYSPCKIHNVGISFESCKNFDLYKQLANKHYHHSCIKETVLSQVRNSAHEVEYPISHGDDRIFGEDNGLAAISWNCELCKDDSGHTCIDDYSNNALDWQKDCSTWTFIIGKSMKKYILKVSILSRKVLRKCKNLNQVLAIQVIYLKIAKSIS